MPGRVRRSEQRGRSRGLRFVPAELVSEIVDGEVRLSIGKDEFERLDEYEEPPPTKQIQAD